MKPTFRFLVLLLSFALAAPNPAGACPESFGSAQDRLSRRALREEATAQKDEKVLAGLEAALAPSTQPPAAPRAYGPNGPEAGLEGGEIAAATRALEKAVGVVPWNEPGLFLGLAEQALSAVKASPASHWLALSGKFEALQAELELVQERSNDKRAIVGFWKSLRGFQKRWQKLPPQQEAAAAGYSPQRASPQTAVQNLQRLPVWIQELGRLQKENGRVRFLREKAGFSSPHDLEKAAGAAWATVSRLETGKRGIGPKIRQKIQPVLQEKTGVPLTLTFQVLRLPLEKSVNTISSTDSRFSFIKNELLGWSFNELVRQANAARDPSDPSLREEFQEHLTNLDQSRPRTRRLIRGAFERGLSKLLGRPIRLDGHSHIVTDPVAKKLGDLQTLKDRLRWLLEEELVVSGVEIVEKAHIASHLSVMEIAFAQEEKPESWAKIRRALEEGLAKRGEFVILAADLRPAAGLEEIPAVHTLEDTVGSVRLVTVPVGEEQVAGGLSLPTTASRPEAIVRIRTSFYIGGPEHLTLWHPKVADPTEFWRQSVQRHGQLIELFRENPNSTPAGLITEIDRIMTPATEESLGAPSTQPPAAPRAYGPNGPEAGLEEPELPQQPSDFGKGDYGVVRIGGSKAHRLRPEDRIFPNVTYETPLPSLRNIPFSQVRIGTQIAVGQIQSYAVPLEQLGRFSIGPLTFRIVPMGTDQTIQQSEEESGGGVAVAPMAKRYLLQIWLNESWVALDMVHLEDEVPVVIGKEDLPRTILNPSTELDLEGRIGRRVDNERYRDVFEGWRAKGPSEPERRIAISWRENELAKVAYLPRQALSNAISRGDARVVPRPGWNVANRKYVPQYLQTGHVQIEIIGDEAVFSDLGSTNPTTIEVRRDWVAREESLIQDGAAIGDWLWDKSDKATGGSGKGVEQIESGADSGQSGLSSSDEQVSRLAESLHNKLIVIGALTSDGVAVNPQKAVQFPLDQPFQVSLRVEKKTWAKMEFVVRDGRLHNRLPATIDWNPSPQNRFLTEEEVPVPGQTWLDASASRVPESYEVLYTPATNTVLILNHSPYQLQIVPLSPNAAGLEGDEEDLKWALSIPPHLRQLEKVLMGQLRPFLPEPKQDAPLFSRTRLFFGWLSGQSLVDIGAGWQAREVEWLRAQGSTQACALDPEFSTRIQEKEYLWPIRFQDAWPIGDGTVRVICSFFAVGKDIQEEYYPSLWGGSAEENYGALAQQLQRKMAQNGLAVLSTGLLDNALLIEAIKAAGLRLEEIGPCLLVTKEPLEGIFRDIAKEMLAAAGLEALGRVQKVARLEKEFVVTQVSRVMEALVGMEKELERIRSDLVEGRSIEGRYGIRDGSDFIVFLQGLKNNERTLQSHLDLLESLRDGDAERRDEVILRVQRDAQRISKWVKGQKVKKPQQAVLATAAGLEGGISQAASPAVQTTEMTDEELHQLLIQNHGVVTMNGKTYVLLDEDIELPVERTLFDQLKLGSERLPTGVKRISLPQEAVPAQKHQWLIDLIGSEDVLLLDADLVGLEEAQHWKPADVTPWAMIRVTAQTFEQIAAAGLEGINAIVHAAHERYQGQFFSVGGFAIEYRRGYLVAIATAA